jgi:prophage regulatory protein
MRLLKLPAVIAKAGKSRSGIYEAVKAGTFPAPVETGPHAVAWVEAEIDAWIAAKIAARDESGNVDRSLKTKAPTEAHMARSAARRRAAEADAA